MGTNNIIAAAVAAAALTFASLAFAQQTRTVEETYKTSKRIMVCCRNS
jgi:hypothetical protein